MAQVILQVAVFHHSFIAVVVSWPIKIAPQSCLSLVLATRPTLQLPVLLPSWLYDFL
jgi:hypothetical protein